jgi:hypothetical protein
MSWAKIICFLSFRELTNMRPVLVWDITYMQHNIPEERGSRPLRGMRMKSHEVIKLLLWPPRKKLCSCQHAAQSVLLSLWTNNCTWISWPGCWRCWINNVQCQHCVDHCLLLHLVELDVISGLEGRNLCSGVCLSLHLQVMLYTTCV